MPRGAMSNRRRRALEQRAPGEAHGIHFVAVGILQANAVTIEQGLHDELTAESGITAVPFPALSQEDARRREEAEEIGDAVGFVVGDRGFAVARDSGLAVPGESRDPEEIDAGGLAWLERPHAHSGPVGLDDLAPERKVERGVDVGPAGDRADRPGQRIPIVMPENGDEHGALFERLQILAEVQPALGAIVTELPDEEPEGQKCVEKKDDGGELAGDIGREIQKLHQSREETAGSAGETGGERMSIGEFEERLHERSGAVNYSASSMVGNVE